MLPVTSSMASRVSAAAGYSAAPSACASEPPIVPRLRIWKCPISEVARVISGAARAMLRLPAMQACVVIAPIRSTPSCSRMYRSEGTRLRSTRWSKRARRKAIIGIRLCPPASTFTSSA